MDIREYTYLMAFVKNGSFTAAANELFISQPSLSVYIHRLEKRIGLKLFQRIDGKILLTHAGKRYIEYAEKIIDLDTRLMQELENLRNSASAEVSLGISTVRGEGLFPTLLPEFTKKYPDIKIRLVEGNSRELQEMLKANTIDLAVFSKYHEPDKLEYSTLAVEHICVAIPAKYPVCEKAATLPEHPIQWIDIRELKDAPFILLKNGQGLRKVVENLFAEADFQPNVYHETPNSKTALSLTAAGMGVSFISDSFIRHFCTEEMNNVRFFLVGNPVLTRKVIIAYHARNTLPRSAQTLLRFIETVGANMDFRDLPGA